MFCLACGEPVKPVRDQMGKLTLAENPLFHCANLQGVILGVGLAMLEQLFAEQVDDAAIPGNKRKSLTDTQTVDADDEDQIIYMLT